MYACLYDCMLTTESQILYFQSYYSYTKISHVISQLGGTEVMFIFVLALGMIGSN